MSENNEINQNDKNKENIKNEKEYNGKKKLSKKKSKSKFQSKNKRNPSTNAENVIMFNEINEPEELVQLREQIRKNEKKLKKTDTQ